MTFGSLIRSPFVSIRSIVLPLKIEVYYVLISFGPRISESSCACVWKNFTILQYQDDWCHYFFFFSFFLFADIIFHCSPSTSMHIFIYILQEHSLQIWQIVKPTTRCFGAGLEKSLNSITAGTVRWPWSLLLCKNLHNVLFVELLSHLLKWSLDSIILPCKSVSGIPLTGAKLQMS